MKMRFSEEQIIAAVKRIERGENVRDLSRETRARSWSTQPLRKDKHHFDEHLSGKRRAKFKW